MPVGIRRFLMLTHKPLMEGINMAFYKVVRDCIDGSKISFWETKAIVNYEKDRFVYPRQGCGPLAVFDSEETATKFIFGFDCCSTSWTAAKCALGDYYYVSLWECEIIPSEHNKLWNDKGCIGPGLPNGTVLADAVKLTKLIG